MSLSAVLTLSKVLRVHLFHLTKVCIDFDALIEIPGHLLAFGYFIGTTHSVVVEAMNQGAFVHQAWESLIGLYYVIRTLYSWNSKGTSLVRLRWFSGRSRR